MVQLSAECNSVQYVKQLQYVTVLKSVSYPAMCNLQCAEVCGVQYPKVCSIP